MRKVQQRMIEVLKASGNGWHSRAELAARLGKNALNPAEQTALDWLISQAVVEKAIVPTSKPSSLRIEYRLMEGQVEQTDGR